MELNLMVAGFGGQGVMMIGKLLSQATCDSTDYNVTFFPSYGAQQRGGTANNRRLLLCPQPPPPSPLPYLSALSSPSLGLFPSVHSTHAHSGFALHAVSSSLWKLRCRMSYASHLFRG